MAILLGKCISCFPLRVRYSDFSYPPFSVDWVYVFFSCIFVKEFNFNLIVNVLDSRTDMFEVLYKNIHEANLVECFLYYFTYFKHALVITSSVQINVLLGFCMNIKREKMGEYMLFLVDSAKLKI